VTITKIENFYIDTRTKIHSKNAILFDQRRKITNLSRKNRFRTVASHRRLAVLNWRSSSIDPS